jgi:hypothetical protein
VAPAQTPAALLRRLRGLGDHDRLVDEYRSEKVIERERITAAAAAGRPIRDRRGRRRVALSNESINKTLVLLANILDTPSSTACSRAARRGAGDGG